MLIYTTGGHSSVLLNNGGRHAACNCSSRGNDQRGCAVKRVCPNNHTQRPVHVAAPIVEPHVSHHQLYDDVQCHGSELSKQLPGTGRVAGFANGYAQ